MSGIEFGQSETIAIRMHIEGRHGTVAWSTAKERLGEVLALFMSLNEEVSKWFPNRSIIDSMDTCQTISAVHSILLAMTVEYDPHPSIVKIAGMYAVLCHNLARKSNSQHHKTIFLGLASVFASGQGLH